MFLVLKKIIIASAAVACITSWFAWGFLENMYVTYPRSPVAAEGRIVPHPVKGIVVYITKDQQELLSWIVWAANGSAIVVVLVLIIHWGDPFKSKKSK
jgi:hypothetical protein